MKLYDLYLINLNDSNNVLRIHNVSQKEADSLASTWMDNSKLDRDFCMVISNGAVPNGWNITDISKDEFSKYNKEFK